MLRRYKGSYLSYVLAFSFFYYSLGLFSSVMTVYLISIGKDLGQTAFIISAAGVMTLVLQPVLGYFSDKTKSPRLISAYAMMISLCTGAIYSFFRHDILLFILYGLTVSLTNGVMPLTEKIALNSEYDYGKIRIWGSIGFACASQSAALIYDYISTTAVYIAFCLSVVITVLGLLGLEEPKNTNTTEESVKKKINVSIIFKTLTRNKAFLLFLLICFLFQGASATSLTYFPLLITSAGGSVSMYGTAMLLATLFEVPVILFSSPYFMKINLKTILLITFGIIFVRFAWYATMPSANAVVYVFFFQALSTMLFIMVTNQILLRIVEEEYFSTALSLSAVFGRGFGALIFQNLFGQLLNNQPLSFLYAMLAILSLIGFVIGIFVPLEKKPANP